MLRKFLLFVAFAAFIFTATAQERVSNELTKKQIQDMSGLMLCRITVLTLIQ
jgi:hypothetical protein